MWSELSLPWQAAFEMAWEAACCGCIPIGAVIVDADGRLVAAGRNRRNEPRVANSPNLAGNRIAHAELNALYALDDTSVNPRQCTIYTTTEPCPMCAGAIVMATLRHVCYASRDPWAGSTHLYTGDTYLGSKHVRVEGPPSPIFEEILVALQVDYFIAEGLRRGPGSVLDRDGPFFAAHEAVFPRGVAFGERLYGAGLLNTLRAGRTPAGQALDDLEQKLEGVQPVPTHL